MRDEQELPEGWQVAQLDDLLSPGGLFDGPFGSSLKTSDYTESGVRVVRLENLANLRFVEEKRTYISPGKYSTLKRHTVVAGDILFGSFLDDAVRVAMLPELDTPAIAKADCFCIRPRVDLVTPRFLMYQLGSTSTRNSLVEDIHGATRPRVTTRQLRGLQIALPDLPEQERIVAKVEEVLTHVEAARVHLSRAGALLGGAATERLGSAAARTEVLIQSILARAFRGELVPTEAELNRRREASTATPTAATRRTAAQPAPRRSR